LDTA
jgi:hypothetical protein